MRSRCRNARPAPARRCGTSARSLADGYSVLIFPEGRRTDTGEVGRFMPGVGMIGARLDVPVVPIRLEGLDKVLHPKMRFPERHPVRIVFGAPLHLTGDDYPALAARVREALVSA